MSNLMVLKDVQLMSLLVQNQITKGSFKLTEPRQSVLSVLFNSYLVEVERRNRQLAPNDKLEEQLNKVTDWLVNPNTPPWLWLCGNCGNGKTTMMKAIRRVYDHFPLLDQFEHKPMDLVIMDAKTIVEICKKDEKEFLKTKKLPMLAIDDLGCEPREVMEYGNIITPMIDLIQYRYNDSLLTIFSTNLTREQVAETYDKRITDRLNEMVEKVVFKNESYR